MVVNVTHYLYAKKFSTLKLFINSVYIMKRNTNDKSNKIKAESTKKLYSTRSTKKEDDQEIKLKVECKIEEMDDVKPDISNFKFEKKKVMKRDHKTIKFDEPETKEIQSVAVKVEKQDKGLIKKGKWAPENWEQVLGNLREMRKDHDAPVDKMGCDKCMDESASDQVMHIYIILTIV